MTEQRVRAINAPWPVLTLIAVLLGAFAAQWFVGVEPVAVRLGFEPDDLLDGRVDTMVLSIFLHGGWAHVLTNSAFALAFATPVSWRMGEDARGAAAFFIFFLACGILGNVGYALFSMGHGDLAVGASGAVAGMMGASSRLMGRQGDLAPFRSRIVIGMAVAWLLVNLVFGLVLVGWMPGAGGAPIAWQVHLAGYAAGLFLISPALALIGRLKLDHGIEN
jgi:membrane associated rhomboid family serine protease